MNMAICYSLSKKPIAGKELYFATTRSAGVVSLEDLCCGIARRCSVKMPVLRTAVMALSLAMKEELEQGRIVDMGEIGRFQVSCGSNGVEEPEHFCSGRDMKDAKIIFRPGRGLKGMLKTVQYKQVAVL